MKGRATTAIIALILLVVLAGLVVWIGTRNGQEQVVNETNTPIAEVGKPQLVATRFHGCPPSGDGGDPVLNTLKNRIDESPSWNQVSIASLLALGWPESIEHQSRSRWSRADAEAIAQHEGTPIQVEGYLVRAKKMSPESCNCHAVQYVDFHIWMVDDPNKTRDLSVVIETTPRVMEHHPNWTVSRLNGLATRQEKVRISGWLMMDPEHPNEVGKTRGTIWEIHPVMQIETFSRGAWRPLDNGTTGVNSGNAAAVTAPPITPVGTATMPPASNPAVQDNRTVRIASVLYDGTKGSTEPDEYVEITNDGAEPVDMTSWTLQDKSGDNVFTWESYTLQPGDSIRVYTNEVHEDTGGFTFDSGRSLWGNSGDIAQLFDADGQLISRYAYGKEE